jgi:transposase
MPHPQKEPLRPLTPAERQHLEQVCRSPSERADRVVRARALLAVADGHTLAATARLVGRWSGDAIVAWVRRFNHEGLAALDPRRGHGPPVQYGATERDRILATFRRDPERATDGTGTWSLTTLQRTLRRQPGLERISTFTILRVLTDAGYTWQRTRTWCHTGTALRKRKDGSVHRADDPDTPKNKRSSNRRIG